MSAKAAIAAWLLDHQDEDIFTAGEQIIAALREAGYEVVPIKPSERMLDELARIGDGPMISGGECWGYMLAAAVAEQVE